MKFGLVALFPCILPANVQNHLRLVAAPHAKRQSSSSATHRCLVYFISCAGLFLQTAGYPMRTGASEPIILKNRLGLDSLATRAPGETGGHCHK